MENIIELKNYSSLAVEKIEDELKHFAGDRYGSAVKNHVASTLKHFCEENEQFAEVVYKTKRTLSDCCKEIMRGCGSSISDIDVYRGAVKHYFPNAEIDFHLTIRIAGEAPSEEEMAAAPKHTDTVEGSNSEQPKPKNPKKYSTSQKPAPVKKAAPAKKTPPAKKEEKSQDPNVIQLTLF